MSKIEKLDPKVYDEKFSYVAKDRIWRDNIRKINWSAKQWHDSWGFYLNQSNKLNPQPTYSDGLPKLRLPKLSSAMIGWRSTNELCRLEKYGPYTKGKRTITKSLNWPNEAI
jgi:hypothetical protein